jgi:hypothetical protein
MFYSIQNKFNGTTFGSDDGGEAAVRCRQYAFGLVEFVDRSDYVVEVRVELELEESSEVQGQVR